MFNNCDCHTNGESMFYNKIKNKIGSIFDVGCRSDSIFVSFEGEVHYFDPNYASISLLKNIPNMNTNSVFNDFGLGNESTTLPYYPSYESFYNRINSCQNDDSANKIDLKIIKAKEYMLENNIHCVDFVKIDTEGFELNVLRGFEELLKTIKIVQFEYGGTFLDNNTKLIDVINHLKEHNFDRFMYLSQERMIEITDFTDHYQYCNIVCFNKTFLI